MAKNSIDAYGASGKSNVLFFEPENLHLVTDTERMWVVGKNEFYHKETGRRHFAENTRRRLLLDTIKPIGVKHV